jgi:hypothetical protein
MEGLCAFLKIIVGLLGLVGVTLVGYIIVWLFLYCGAAPPRSCDSVSPYLIPILLITIIIAVISLVLVISGWKQLK